MTGTDVLSAPPSKTSAGATARPPLVAAPPEPEKKAIVLDMGEASREQGFRLNGCR
jgi:hypothetical protein